MPVLRRGAVSLRHLLASRLALLVIGLFAGLVVVELLLRVFQLGPLDEGVPLMSASDFQVLPGVLTPNQDVTDLRDVILEAGLWRSVVMMMRMLPEMVATYRRARRMNAVWPWRNHADYLQRPLADIRRELGIEVMDSGTMAA